MIFSTKDTVPQTVYQRNKTEMKSDMSLLGFNRDGTQNTWGHIMSFLPGINGLGAIGAEIAKGQAQGTDAENNVTEAQKARINNFLTQAGIGASILTAGAGSGLASAGAGIASKLLGGSSGEDANDGDEDDMPEAGASVGASVGGIEDMTRNLIENKIKG
jgi:hypothetical protein